MNPSVPRIDEPMAARNASGKETPYIRRNGELRTVALIMPRISDWI